MTEKKQRRNAPVFFRLLHVYPATELLCPLTGQLGSNSTGLEDSHEHGYGSISISQRLISTVPVSMGVFRGTTGSDYIMW